MLITRRGGDIVPGEVGFRELWWDGGQAAAVDMSRSRE
jgi:hypothetical protein